MTDRDAPLDKASLAQRIHSQIARVKLLRGRAALGPAAADDRMRLRAWQAGRLGQTYPDLLASARYRAAAEFFLSDLYGPKDFSERDDEVAKIIPTMTRLLPAAAIQTFALALELDCLSEELDAGIVQELRRAQPEGALAITPETYAAAYRIGAHRTERERQIELVDRIGVALDSLTRKPLIATAIELMRTPARLAGLIELHLFFERGFNAFRTMRGAGEFLAIVRGRETELMNRLYGGVPDPFA